MSRELLYFLLGFCTCMTFVGYLITLYFSWRQYLLASRRPR